MKNTNKLLLTFLLLFYISCNNNDDNIENEIKLIVSPVERDIMYEYSPLKGTLSFVAGENTPEGSSYKLYFDTSSNPTTEYLLTENKKEYKNLKFNEKYYWKVETIGKTGDILATSTIWDFTTSNNIVIRTQEDLELLGSNKYTNIPGQLLIGDFINIPFDTTPESTDIKDLSSLNDLTSVGQLIINNNNLLTNLKGLGNLKSTDSGLFIGQGANLNGGNSSLEDISDLSNLASIGGSLIIYNNDKLINLIGLQSITFIGKELVIENNNSLNNFCSIQELIKSNSGITGQYLVKDNNYNPTKTDITNGKCEK